MTALQSGTEFFHMPVHPDARELGRRWFEEVWNARRDTWNQNAMLASLATAPG